MEPMRVVFWDRDSLGREENPAELYVGYNSQTHKEGNIFTMQVNTESLRKVEGDTRGVGSGHRRGEALLTMKEVADFSCLLLELKPGDSPKATVW